MEEKIKRIFMKFFCEKLIAIKKLPGGISFGTYRVETDKNRRYVFRYGASYVNSGGRYIDIGQTFRREKFFFDTIQSKLSIKVPHIHVVDDTREEFDYIYEIYDYIEGYSLEEIDDVYLDDKIYYKIGKIIAGVNKIRVNDGIIGKEKWGLFFSKRLKERLIPLKKENLFSDDEIQIICNFYKKYQYKEEMAFLHLDVRKCNIIYDNGLLGLIDAENAEFGDPLFEIARIDVYGDMNSFFYKGYMDEMGIKSINRESIQYYGYRLEALAFLTNVFINEIEVDADQLNKMIISTIQLKGKILNSIG